MAIIVTASNIYGGKFRSGILGTSAITNAYAGQFSIYKAAGTIDNAYGIYINNISEGDTSNYAIYSVGGTNYFGGNVGIGDTDPSARLTASSTGEQFRLIYDEDNSKYASFTIDSNGDLNLDLASANSTTTISDNLSVLGYLNVEGSATTTGSQYIKEDLTVDGQCVTGDSLLPIVILSQQTKDLNEIDFRSYLRMTISNIPALTKSNQAIMFFPSMKKQANLRLPKLNN